MGGGSEASLSKKGDDTVISGSQGQLSHGKTVWQRPFAFSPDRTLSPLVGDANLSSSYLHYEIVHIPTKSS
jgi:hypothetical protein